MVIMRLTLHLQEDSVAGQAHPEAPVWPGGQHQPVGPTRATDHAATPLAVVSPDQQPGQGHHHMSLDYRARHIRLKFFFNFYGPRTAVFR